MTVVLVALVGGAVYFVAHRFDGGPLGNRSPANVTDQALFDVGQTQSFVDALLVNTGSREVRVEKVAPQWTLGDSRVEVWVPRRGVRRPSNQPAVHWWRNGGKQIGPIPAFPPPGTTLADLRPAVGARVAGRRGSTVAWLPLLITVTPVRPGCAGFGGLVVEYRAGRRRYRRVMTFAYGGHAAQAREPGQRSRPSANAEARDPLTGLTSRQHRRRFLLCDKVLGRLFNRSFATTR